MTPRITLRVLTLTGLIGCGAFLIGRWCMWITDLTHGWPVSGLWFLAMGPGPFFLLLTVLTVRSLPKGLPDGGYTSEGGIRANEVPAVVSPSGDWCPAYDDGKHHRIVGTGTDKDGCVVPRPRCAGCYKDLP